MAGQHYQYNGHELGQTSRDAEGQRACKLQSMESQRVGHEWVTEQQQQYLGFEVASPKKSQLKSKYLKKLKSRYTVPVHHGK